MQNNLNYLIVKGIIWSFNGNILKQGINIIITIILARLLSPIEFGIIGIIMIFISISQRIVDGGFSSALIRKKKCTENDYSTVFLSNLGISIFLYFLLYIFSSHIGLYFNENIISTLLKVLGFVIIINAFGIVQRVQLRRDLNFKKEALITFYSSISGGVIGIGAAIYGLGVWSLLIKTMSQQLVEVLILWISNKWTPIMTFSKQSFKSLFAFGSKLMISDIIDAVFKKLFYFVIGKYYNPIILGYYTQADNLGKIPSENLNRTIQHVSYSSLSKVKNDPEKLKDHFSIFLKAIMLISFPLMFGIAAAADTIVLVLLGEQWSPAIPFLKLMAITSSSLPLHSLNLNILKIKGRSDIFLKLEIIKKMLIIIIVFSGIMWSIMTMLYGMLILSFIGFFINSYSSGKMLKYSSLKQIKDILPAFFLGCFIHILLLLMNNLFDKITFVFLSQIFIGIIAYFFILEFFKFAEYLKLRNLLINFIKKT
tara:strand:- start:663 stop:2108 length:1446 start_codon:yes stop_codon:yes gene_type:complete